MQSKKAAQTLATKQKLERIARELFAERGFAEVSAEELVARANVTRGALYHHYDGKEGLFEAVVEAAMKDVHAKLAAEAKGAPDALQGLQRGVHAFLKVCTEPATQRLLLVDAPAVMGWHKWRALDAKYGFGLLRQALSAAVKAGLVRNQDPDILAHVLLGALIEAAMVIARSDSPAKERRAAERAIASMIEAWRTGG